MDFFQFVHQFRKTPSQRDRLRLIADSWNHVRRLSPRQRRQLARRLGFEGAEEVLETLAEKKGGAAAQLLLSALELAREARVSDFSRLIHQVADPDLQRELLKKGVPGLEEELAEAAQPPPEPEPPGPIVIPLEVEARAAAEKEVKDPEAAPEAEPEFAQEATGGPPAREPREAETPEAEAAPNADLERFRINLRRLPLVRRFSWLRRHGRRFESATIEDLELLLAEFAAGWARRRAVMTLFRARIPSEIDQALLLIERTLTERREIRWCVMALAQARGLSREEEERLLERVLESPRVAASF